MIQTKSRSGIALVLGLGLAMSSNAGAQDTACTLGEGQSFSVHVSRPNPKKSGSNEAAKPSTPLKNAYDMNIFVQDGGLHSVQVDTGSTGIVLSRSSVPEALWKQTTRNGVMSYSSDNLNLLGRYVTRAVTLGGDPKDTQGKGERPTTVPIDILLVACSCGTTPEDASKPPAQEADLKDLTSCETLNGKSFQIGQKTAILTACKASSGTSMMGVGFNRGNGSSANNPFLQLEAVRKGTVHAGYVIQETEIQLGLNQKNTAGFQFARLEPDTRFPTQPAPVREWMEPQACVQFDQTKDSVCGSLLMDTGINYMMLTQPAAQQPKPFVDKKANVPPGTAMTLTFPSPGQPVLTYAFKLGTDEWAPNFVSWRGTQGTAHHINTGRNLMSVADYAYDARCGQLGFHRRP